MKTHQGIMLLAALFCFSHACVNAQQLDFPSFRGADGASSSQAKTPTQWTEENFVWKTDLPGRGWSSPVHADGKIWLTTVEEVAETKEEIAKKLKGVTYATLKTAVKSIEMFALCIDLKSGSLQKKIPLGKHDDPQLINPMNSFASPTCAIADGKVICHFGAHGTWCLDTKTLQKLWHRELVVQHSVGAGSSPVISDGKVILVCDGTDAQYVAAVDLKTGDDVWKTDRPPIEKEEGEFRKAYCTPLIAEIDGMRQAIVPGAQWICSYNVETGEEIWRADYGFGFSLTPMAVWSDGLVSFTTGYMQSEFVSLKPGKGDITDQIVWRAKSAPEMSSFVTHEGKIYAVSGGKAGLFQCRDVATGELIKKVRLLGNVSASVLQSGGHLYVANREGKMKVLECTPELKEVGSFNFDSPIYATSTVAGDDLLVRTRDSIIRIGSKSK